MRKIVMTLVMALVAGGVVGAEAAAADAARTAPAKAAAGATSTTIKVTFGANSFALSRSTLDAGTTVFVVRNSGKRPHSLAIAGPGLVKTHTPTISGGKSATLTVTLRAGAYLLTDGVTRTPVGRWLEVSPAVNVTSTGNGSVVVPVTVTTGMNCD
jgi:plastocyanin